MDLPSDLENSILQAIGLEQRELASDPDLIAASFKANLPPTVRQLVQGAIPEKGFGISGAAGVGKTCAMVGMLKLHLRAAYRKRREAGEPPQDPRSLTSTYRWVEWPRMAHWMRANAVVNSEAVHAMVSAMCKVPVLILDDLGAERRKGDYQDDYAAAELDYIVASSRYRACLPTWYTTNLQPDRLADFYGARFASRLVSDSPVVVMTGKDRRVAG